MGSVHLGAECRAGVQNTTYTVEVKEEVILLFWLRSQLEKKDTSIIGDVLLDHVGT